MDLSDHDVLQRAEADRREVDPPIEVETARVVESWPARLVGERTAGMVGSRSGADGRQRWVRAVDLRPVSGSQL
jgi:hypothetical protein